MISMKDLLEIFSPACHICWEAAMGPRLGSPLHDPYDVLDAESRPPETVFGGAAPRKTGKNQFAKWRKVPCDRMVLICSNGPVSLRPSRGPCWQQACPFLASGDHFRPCQPPAPTGAVALSRTCKRVTTLPTGVGAVRICKKVTVAAGMSPEKTKCALVGGPGLSKNRAKRPYYLPVLRIEPTSPP